MRQDNFVSVPLSRRALFSGAFGMAGLALLSACSSPGTTGGTASAAPNLKLVGSEWGGVWDKALTELASDFQKKTGFSMVNSIDGNNGLVKIQQNPNLYDVAWLTADKSTAGLVSGDLLPIDTSRVTQYANIPDNLLAALKEKGKLSGIPVSWGATGILYRSDLVPFEITSWKDLWRTELRNSIGIQAMPALGAAGMVRMAARTWGSGPNDLTAAWAALAKLKPNVQYQYTISSDTVNKLADGSLKVATTFADMGLPLADKGVKVVLPKDGYGWSPQVICIPKNSKNIDGAYAIINYILDPKIQAKWIALTSVGPANSTTVIPAAMKNRLVENDKVATKLWNDDFLTMGQKLDSWAQQWQQVLG